MLLLRSLPVAYHENERQTSNGNKTEKKDAVRNGEEGNTYYLDFSLLLFDTGLHCEMEGGETLRLLAHAAHQRDELAQPVGRLSVDVRLVALRELHRVSLGEERLDELERAGLRHGRLDLLVAAQHRDGEERVVADAVVVGEREREEPLGHALHDHLVLVLEAAEDGEVGERDGAVAQRQLVGGAARVEDRLEPARLDHLRAGVLRVLEEVAEDAGRHLRQLQVLLGAASESHDHV